MPSKYQSFDVSQLSLKPLAQRENIVQLDDILPLHLPSVDFAHPALPELARQIVARAGKASVILMMGAHVIKQGLSRYVIELIRRHWVDGIAFNGAGVIHDFELALQGATSESVGRYIREGQFGLWRETGRINDIVKSAAREGLGFGEAMGREIALGDYPHRDLSILSAAYQANVPVTVHVGIGYDIIHEHPNFDGGATGACSYRDFLIFAHLVEKLQGGALLCFGSAIMAPEVYLKALSMARNVAVKHGRSINDFLTAVFDIIELPQDLSHTPPMSEPAYYYRPFKTILVRTVSDGGKSFYIRGDHRQTLPALYAELMKQASPTT
jgi:hypothetical protein